MNDEQLLELAATAAQVMFFDTKQWNPLESNEDALTLAVRLKIGINIVEGKTVCWHHKTGVVVCENFIDWNKTYDGNAATRRAIVKVAAEIGRKMR